MIINIDLVYPVGSIYFSMNSTNPSKYFGGTWTQISQGRCLVGVDTTQTEFNTVNKTGGKKTHTLTINEMPSHRHTFSYYNYVVNGGGGANGLPYNITNKSYVGGDAAGMTNVGGSQAHNNLQPYLTCYIWQRTA